VSTDPTMRASDADREVVAERLRDAHAEGRLTMPEFEERLDAAYAARTLGDLVPLTRDLPAAAPVAPRRPAQVAHPGGSHRGAWASWLAAVLVCTTIWAISAVGAHDSGDFWPIWVAGPWGALLLARTISGRSPDRERPGRRDGQVDHR
jgi:hypothetical protein